MSKLTITKWEGFRGTYRELGLRIAGMSAYLSLTWTPRLIFYWRKRWKFTLG